MMKYTIELTAEESNLIWDAICNFANEVKDTEWFKNKLNLDLLQSVIDKVAKMDEEISSNYYGIDKNYY